MLKAKSSFQAGFAESESVQPLIFSVQLSTPLTVSVEYQLSAEFLSIQLLSLIQFGYWRSTTVSDPC